MFIPRKSIRIPLKSKIFFDDQAALEFDNDNKSFQFSIDGDTALQFDKDGIAPTDPFDVNIMKVNDNIINTENGTVDTGTIRVTIASDSPPITIDTINDTIPVSIDTDDIFNGPIPTTSTISNFPDPQNINATQIKGITISTGSSTVDTGTQRVVLTNAYESTTNAKITDINIPSQTTNLAVNNTQINGNTISTGASTVDSGTQRMVLTNAYESTTNAKITDINIPSQTTNLGVNTTQIKGVAISTGSSTVDTGTQRVVLTNAYESTTNTKITDVNIPSQTTNLGVNTTQIKGVAISTGSSTVDTGTQRIVLTNAYESTVIQKTPLDFLTQRRAQLYWSSAITGGAISHNLALNFTLGAYAALTPPLVTSISFNGSSVVYLQAVEMSFRITGGAVHNTAWGKGGSSLTTGFGIYYKTSSGGSQIPIVNNSTATNQLPSDAIVGNSGLVRSFDEWSNFDPGAGDVVFKLKRVFPVPILMDNTGGYFLSFGAKEDLTANGVVLFHVMLHYRS